MSKRPELVTCHLCGGVWRAPTGAGRRYYHEHYTLEHYDLELERGVRS
jgi:hypothetical protein